MKAGIGQPGIPQIGLTLGVPSRTVAPQRNPTYALGLKAGDWVEVRSAGEVLATLDAQGCLEGLPFMPEMQRHCGQRLRVFKAAHKTCDTIQCYRSRRMANAVHLEGMRCDGSGHDGCQAGCLIYWKEAWLKPVAGPGADTSAPRQQEAALDLDLMALARLSPAPDRDDAEPHYRCQATEVLRATTPLPWWEPQQYAQDLASGNVRWPLLLRALAIHLYGKLRRLCGGRSYTSIKGLAGKNTPHETLDLQPGELVRVRSKEEIMATLSPRLYNRGLLFDVEMVPYCGHVFRVLRRVNRIIDEKTGKMIKMKNECIVLDGVTCSGLLSRNRVGCPRSIYPYWREIWLRRVEGEGSSGTPRLE